jgi:hypothetical protein
LTSRPRAKGPLKERTGPQRAELVVAAVVAMGLCAAPTVGDVGGCGAAATNLDEATFARARKSVDCQRCEQCSLTTNTCKVACDPNAPIDLVWPSTCNPLFHDGEVCIRALQAASCSDYASFVDDVAPVEPSECDFCHLVLDGGASGVGDL